LELRYRQPFNPQLVARMRFTPPQLVAASSFSELYWQIVLPADRHLASEPDLTSCADWQWWGVFVGRRPAKTQAELETWSGASTGQRPTPGQSEYLYSGLASAGTIEMVVAPRWLIVLTASVAVLLPALLWIYVPAVRRLPIVLLLAFVIAAFAVAFPTLAVLVGQASLLGLGCSLAAAWIAHFLSHATRVSPSTISAATLRSTTPRNEATPAPAMSSGNDNPSSATVLRVGGLAP
jgi:hypothetical protein